MKHIELNITELKDKVDFGIITIREDEFKSVLDRLPTESYTTGRQSYALSRLKTSNDDEYLIASVRCPEQGNLAGQSVAQKLIEDLNPQWIIVVGIAGSVPDPDYTLGDVILATRLHDFCVSARLPGENKEFIEEFASKGGPMHPAIQNLLGLLPAIEPELDRWNEKALLQAKRPKVNLADENFYGPESWQSKVRDSLKRYFDSRPVRRLPKVFTGSIASSDTLVKDPNLAGQWRESARQINGIEMELAGVYHAAWSVLKPVLAIRGISDIVGFKRSPDWTSYACHTAASFLLALLRFRPIAPLSVQDTSRPAQTEGGNPISLQSQPVSVFKEKPPNVPPLPKKEQLFSNLLKVSYFPKRLYAAQTKCKKRGQVWNLLKQQTDFPAEDWVYTGKMLYAFHDFSDPIWKDICDVENAEPHDTSHWSASTDQNLKALFIELLKGCLKELALLRDLYYIQQAWVYDAYKDFRYLCYPPTLYFTESPLFRADDFLDVDGQVNTLRQDETPLGKYLFSNLPIETQELIQQYPNVSNRSLLDSLARGFNHLLKIPLYEPDRFIKIRLRRQTLRFLEYAETEEEGIRANRLLLEDLYNVQIAKRYFATRKVVVKSLVKALPREVFKAYFSIKTKKFLYYRHSAFRFEFLRIEGEWYLEITPTYHYTWDGKRVLQFYEGYLKGIKQQEDNEAVFRQVMFWSKVLTDEKTEFLDQQKYPYLEFGKLLEFSFDFGVRDELWRNRGQVNKTNTGGRKRGKRSRKTPNTPPLSSGNLFT